MKQGPLERHYGRYRITFRKSEHTVGRPTPHVEVWKGSRKIGNYDIASLEPLPGWKQLPNSVTKFLHDYFSDRQVIGKIKEAIEGSFFDLSKYAGQYGDIPRGFKATVHVDIPEN